MIDTITDYLRNSGEFTKRIKTRHNAFWSDPNGETVRNTAMSRYDKIVLWEDVPHWQRKLSNKANAREFAQMHGCITPTLYWQGCDIASLDFEILPANYVIRPTIGHCSKLVFLMRGSFNLFDNRDYTTSQICEILIQEVAANPGLEFLFEEFLEQKEGSHEILNDYKFYCFNGEIACIQVINRLSPKLGYGSFYNEFWKRLKRVSYTYKPATYQEPPACLQDMVSSAKRLSKAYGLFVRIDFYATYKGCVFGEFTPTPSMGRNYSIFGRTLLLSYWNKYCKGLI